MSTAEADANDLGHLPEWDLGDLYSGTDSEDLKSDLEAAAVAASEFAERYRGRIAEVFADDLGAAIAAYEGLSETLGRIMSFAGLLHAGNVTDPEIGRFFQNTQERVNAIATELIFFSLELNRLEEDDLAAKLEASGALAHYGPWLRDLRVFRPYQLADELETLLHEKEVAGRAAWVRLFDQTMAGLSFEIDGESVALEQALHGLSDPDGDRRRAAAREIGRVLESESALLTLITNTLAKDKEIEDRWRGYELPAQPRHLANQVEPEVVDALVSAVRQAYPRLSHRYYTHKAAWLGQEKLDYWDRNAPLPEDDDRTIAWDEACDRVLAAYGAFSPELADIGRRFFDNAWIDAALRPGKAPGAFAHPTVPSAHPYLHLNYQGRVRDVMTLAHELGHGVHQVLAAGQGALMADTPLTLAETASVFGEQLAFRALLDGESDAGRRRVMIAGKVEDMLNTVVRQIAFYEFERQVHQRRPEGELTAEELGEIWLGVQRESLGPALRFEDDYRHYWSYVPHFLHSPFYVYAYAFGDCLVNSLYAAYQDSKAGFEEKYFTMLRAGGTLRHKELLAPFGLDASDPAFWSRGLAVIESFIDELEAA
ncbi:MAG: M3 family oligoendopeptidase [Alphaproteobacteria bacterium]|jgi:oligoendopeptidase F|nr:M3 family oligoendopeptidase [Alphaproteobacteria bacterium]HJP20821.1 M3 family oligoendopeptidase [Alphaproteobacteria bacterium]